MLLSTSSEVGFKILGGTPIGFEGIFIIYTHMFKTASKAKCLQRYTTFEFKHQFLNLLWHIENTDKHILRRPCILGYLQIFLIIIINIVDRKSVV